MKGIACFGIKVFDELRIQFRVQEIPNITIFHVIKISSIYEQCSVRQSVAPNPWPRS